MVLEAILVKRISGCVKVMTPQKVAQKTFDSSFPVMALNRSGNANDRKYPKPKEDICINWPTVLQELLGQLSSLTRATGTLDSCMHAW